MYAGKTFNDTEISRDSIFKYFIRNRRFSFIQTFILLKIIINNNEGLTFFDWYRPFYNIILNKNKRRKKFEIMS